MTSEITRPPRPITALITSGVGPKHLGWVLAWQAGRVQAQWEEDGQRLTRWIPSTAAHKSDLNPKFKAREPGTTSPVAKPKALRELQKKPRKARNRSSKAKHQESCATCSQPILTGQTARFNPAGLLVHDKHQAKEEVVGPVCPRCFLVGKCDCE